MCRHNLLTLFVVSSLSTSTGFEGQQQVDSSLLTQVVAGSDGKCFHDVPWGL